MGPGRPHGQPDDARGREWTAPLGTIVETLVADTPNLYRTSHAPRYSGFQSTPLMVGNVLYFNTPLSQGVAVDAVTGKTRWVFTGKTRWVFNPKSYEEGTTSMTGTFIRQRGVAYWIDGEDDERVFQRGTGNGYLVCVDAHSGNQIACPDFGRMARSMLWSACRAPACQRGTRLPERDALFDPFACADRRS